MTTRPGPGMTRVARGQLSTVRITPVTDITGARPDCTRCTWTCMGHGLYRIRFISRACTIHGHVNCI